MGDKEVMQMALETLDNMVKVDWREWDEFASVEDFVRWAKSRASFTAEALRTALAQPEPKPVAKVVLTETIGLPCLQWLDLTRQFDFKGGEFLYTAPPQRKECQRCGEVNPAEIHTCTPQREWVGLTDEEIEEVGGPFPFYSNEWCDSDYVDFARAIEAKLKEKNA